MEENFISKEMRSFISIELAQTLLNRADLRLSSSLEQLRKSTDRAYTLTGFLLTCCTGLTVCIVNTRNPILFLTASILWAGISYALWQMFAKVISIHGFKHAGSSARGYLQDKNIGYSKRHANGDLVAANEIYLKNCLLDSIEYAESAYQYNRQQLSNRCGVIDKAMRAIKWSVGADCLIALIIEVIKLLRFGMSLI